MKDKIKKIKKLRKTLSQPKLTRLTYDQRYEI